MNLFERAFTKDKKRPTALEWQAHLDYLLNHYKRCKKDKNHVYFTPKGCGLCMVAEKFKARMDNYKKQQQEPETVRGMEVKKLATENLRRKKLEKEQGKGNHKLRPIIEKVVENEINRSFFSFSKISAT